MKQSLEIKRSLVKIKLSGGYSKERSYALGGELEKFEGTDIRFK